MEILKYCAGGLVAVLVIVYFIGEANTGTCKVVSHNAGEEAFLVNGALDYGVVITARVALEGADRNVTVTSRLETSTGDYIKSVTIGLRDGQSRHIKLEFPEPVLGTQFGNYYTSCT